MKFIKYAYSYWDVKKIEDGLVFAEKEIGETKKTKRTIKVNVPLSENEVFEVDFMHELDWNETSLLDNTSRGGWLNPEGKFFGCSYHQHEQQAKYVHRKKDGRPLELEGWCRIRYVDEQPQEPKVHFDFETGKFPTQKQLSFLKSKRYDTADLLHKIRANRCEESQTELGASPQA
jgi:hypothetical protein